MSNFRPFGSLIDKIRNRDDDDFDGTYGYSDSTMDDEDVNREGMYLILMTVIFLFLLVVLRYGCICFIDVVILCKYRRDRRPGQSLLRRILSICCPRWFPPILPEEDTDEEQDPEGQAGSPNDDPTATNTNTNSDGGSEDDGMELIERNSNYAKRLVRILTESQRRCLFASVLDHRTVTEADVLEWPGAESQGCSCASEENATTPAITAVPNEGPTSSTDSNADTAICCPICIQDIKVGDRICQSKRKTCHHLFHFDCMLEWLVTGSTLCPYCRREIFTRSMLEEAYRKQQQQQQPNKEKEAP